MLAKVRVLEGNTALDPEVKIEMGNFILAEVLRGFQVMASLKSCRHT